MSLLCFGVVDVVSVAAAAVAAVVADAAVASWKKVQPVRISGLVSFPLSQTFLCTKDRLESQPSHLLDQVQ